MAESDCRLCFEKKPLSIGIFAASGIDLRIAEIIRKHFPDEVRESDDLLPKFVCVHCWTKLENFHEFYNSVDEAKNIYLRNAVKEELPNFIQINCDGFDEGIPSVKNEPMNIDSINSEPSLFEIRGSRSQDDFGGLIYENRDTKRIENGEEMEYKNNSSIDEVIVDAKTMAAVAEKEALSSRGTNKAQDDGIDRLQTEEFHVKCALCNHLLRTTSEASHHYQNEHNECNQRKQIINCCELRLRPFDIPHHNRYHLNPDAFKCEICGKRLMTKREFISHKREHFRIEFTCDVCKKIFANKGNVANHILRNHVVVPAVQPQYECKICKKKTITALGLRHHEKRHVVKQCDVCKKTFEKFYALEDHIIRMHTTKKQRFECEICKKCFTSQKFRTIHVKQVHERKFRRVCYICAKDCSTGNALQRHLLEEHSGVEQPRVNCHVCDKSYKNDKGLKSHMMVHEDEGKRFPCPHCSKISPNRRALGTHIVEQHKFKPQKCNLCEKECKTKRELREHISTHTGEYLYNCAYCTQKFKSHSGLYQHYKRCHPIEWKADRPTNPRTNMKIEG